MVDDRKIRDLNKKHLKKNSATDVLAFRMHDGSFSELNPQLLGDVVISVETAKRSARSLNTSFNAELCLYLIHGILHLLGYDDTSNKEFLRMQKIQKEILKSNA